MDWMDYMKKGMFEEAWKISDKELNAGTNRDYLHTPRHYQNIWDGSPLNNKKVLVRCYHGLGDSVMFVRYIPMLKKIAKEVIVWIQPELLELFKTVEGIDKLYPLHDGTPDVDFDIDIEIMELAHYFRTSLTTIPSIFPYISVEPFEQVNRDFFSVGLIWQAGNWNQARNVPFHLLYPLFELKNIQYFMLQENAVQAGWTPEFGNYPGTFNLTDFARLLKGMDLIITVDSMPAHLAGALNVPVWLFLHKHCDWRWMESGIQSPWYASMKIFRQKTEGEWNPVIKQVMTELEITKTTKNPQVVYLI